MTLENGRVWFTSQMKTTLATHVRYLENIKFFNGMPDIQKGEIVEIVRPVGSGDKASPMQYVQILKGRRFLKKYACQLTLAPL